MGGISPLRTGGRSERGGKGGGPSLLAGNNNLFRIIRCIDRIGYETALEKYGRPFNGRTRPRELAGAFVKNPFFAARRDNSGLVGMRHMLHMETDLYKQ